MIKTNRETSSSSWHKYTYLDKKRNIYMLKKDMCMCVCVCVRLLFAFVSDSNVACLRLLWSTVTRLLPCPLLAGSACCASVLLYCGCSSVHYDPGDGRRQREKLVFFVFFCLRDPGPRRTAIFYEYTSFYDFSVKQQSSGVQAGTSSSSRAIRCTAINTDGSLDRFVLFFSIPNFLFLLSFLGFQFFSPRIFS